MRNELPKLSSPAACPYPVGRLHPHQKRLCSSAFDRAPRELDRSLPIEQLQQDEHPLIIRVLRTSRDAQED
jgi:hypothetical protein